MENTSQSRGDDDNDDNDYDGVSELREVAYKDNKTDLVSIGFVTTFVRSTK